jgi:hypothetical protein
VASWQGCWNHLAVAPNSTGLRCPGPPVHQPWCVLSLPAPISPDPGSLEWLP